MINFTVGNIYFSNDSCSSLSPVINIVVNAFITGVHGLGESLPIRLLLSLIFYLQCTCLELKLKFSSFAKYMCAFVLKISGQVSLV